jgi:hypothetical protein
MRDVGGLNLALLIVVVVAAVTLDRLVVRTALAAVLFFAVVHFIFHATHLENFPRGDAIAQTVSLGVTVLLPAAPALAVVPGSVAAWRARWYLTPTTRCGTTTSGSIG